MIVFNIFISILLTCNHAGFADELQLQASSDTPESENDLSETVLSSSENSIRFLIMGDWGTQTKVNSNSNNNNQNKNRKLENRNRNNNANQGNGQNTYTSVLVAQAMAKYATSTPADFLLALGDNFYNNGVASVEDALWTTYYKNVYNFDSLIIPWYAILGNHDYGSNKGAGNIQAQLDYNDGRWHAGHCYMQSFTIPNTAVTVDIVFVDSTLLAPEETYQTSTASGISVEEQGSRQQQQIECLESYLAGSNAHYLLVAGHYPIFSTGKNGPGDMVSMKEVLLPYLLKYDVDAYLCGHDHFMEHLTYKYGGGKEMDFVISGAAGKPDNQLYSGAYCNATMHFAAATGGFSFAQVTSTEMQLKFVDYNGQELYTMYRRQSRQTTETSTGSGTDTTEKTEGLGDTSDIAEGKIVEEDKQDLSEKFGDKMTQMRDFAKNQVASMSKDEMIEIGVLVCVLFSLVVMIFVVTSPRFNGSSEGKRVRSAPVPFLEYQNYMKKLEYLEDKNAAKKAVETSGATVVAANENNDMDPEGDKKQPTTLRYIAASDATIDANWTRRQYYAAKREALARLRPGRRRTKAPHPVLLHSNIHDAINRPHSENVSGLTADFFV